MVVTGGGARLTAQCVLYAGKHADASLRGLTQSLQATVRLVCDDQRVVELGTVRLVATQHSDAVRQPSPHPNLRDKQAVDVPR